jgi:hypothetical protein
LIWPQRADGPATALRHWRARLGGAIERSERVVRLATTIERNGSGLLRHGRPARQLLAQVFALHVRRRHQQRARTRPVLRECAAQGREDAAQAVRHQHRGVVARQKNLFELRNPVAAQRAHPVVLLHPLVAVHTLPTALPVIRPAVLPAGQDQDAERRTANMAISGARAHPA